MISTRIKTKEMRKSDNIFYFKLSKSENMHGIICSFLHKLGFGEESILTFDVPIETLEEEYLGAKEEIGRIDAFASKEYVHFVIEYGNPEKLNELSQEFFDFGDMK